jgi:hypothetical protein
MELLTKLKPATAKTWLYFTAGLMWSGVGILLNSFAYGWLTPLKWTIALSLALVGVALAFTVYRFGFSHSAAKNIRRIAAIKNDKPCLFAFQKWSSYPLIAFMIALGIILRKHSAIPKPYLAILYITMGGSLFLASLHYYKKLISTLVNGRVPQQINPS